jgi:hypothetical protein
MLRSDKVAIRLVERVRHAVSESVPKGKRLVFTVTAPIRLPAKTAATLEERIRSAVMRCCARLELEETIHGNHVRIWLLEGTSRSSKVIGLVHNRGASPQALLALALQ